VKSAIEEKLPNSNRRRATLLRDKKVDAETIRRDFCADDAQIFLKHQAGDKEETRIAKCGIENTERWDAARDGAQASFTR
jgi:hypothetical protein